MDPFSFQPPDDAYQEMMRNIHKFEEALPVNKSKTGASKEDVEYLSKRLMARVLEIEKQGKTRQESVAMFMQKIRRLNAFYTRWGKGDIMQRLIVQVMMKLMHFTMNRPTAETTEQVIAEARIRRGKRNNGNS